MKIKPAKLSSQYMLVALCCGIVFLAASSSPAVAARWTLTQLPPSSFEGPRPVSPTLMDVSCPTDSLCVAVGLGNTLAFSQAPTGGAAQWQVAHPPFPAGSGRNCIDGIDFCAGRRGGLRSISCPSQDFCVAVSYDGFIYVSTDPTGGAGAWSPTNINEGSGLTQLNGVSCSSVSFCVAVSVERGDSISRVFTSTNPASGSWQMTPLSSINLRRVSCGAASLCVATARDGRLLVSTDPTSGAAAWTDAGTPGGPGDLEGVDCVSTLLCAVGNLGGNVLTSTNPTVPTSWKEANAGRSVLITDISCPTAQRCLAVDNNGDVLASTDPIAGAGSWHSENLIPFPDPDPEFGNSPAWKGPPPRNALFGASCSSSSHCTLVGSDGRIFTSTDPFAPTEPGNRRSKRKAVPRPRTTLMFTDYFGSETHTRHRHTHAGFRFYSRSPVKGFECRRGRAPYRRCSSPLRYWVRHGRHVLRVRAIGPTGLRGKAAIKHFRVLGPSRLPSWLAAELASPSTSRAALRRLRAGPRRDWVRR